MARIEPLARNRTPDEAPAEGRPFERSGLCGTVSQITKRQGFARLALCSAPRQPLTQFKTMRSIAPQGSNAAGTCSLL